MDMQTTIKEERQLNSCAFTGHREIEEKDKTTLFRKTLDCVRALVEQGVTAFYNGGAKGFDLLAGEAVLRVKKENTQKQIKLVLCVPCPNQDKAYEESQKTVYSPLASESPLSRALQMPLFSTLKSFTPYSSARAA